MEEIIDAHAHIFPEKIAERAVASIGGFYDLTMHRQGTAQALLESLRAAGVGRCLVCSTATKPEQVRHINDFIYAQCRLHPEFVGFATLHPDMEGLEEEVERILARGYYGVKLHPDFQRFYIDDPAVYPLYRLLEGKLPILFHTGDARYDYSAPARLAKVSGHFPGLRCIAAHFGGYQRWEEAAAAYESPNIFMDTSSTLFTLPVREAYRFFERYGVSRFFFGTDFPMWSHEGELARFDSLGLSKEDRKAILSENFRREILLQNPAGGMQFTQEPI